LGRLFVEYQQGATGHAGIIDGYLYNWVPWLLRGNKALIGYRSWMSARLEEAVENAKRYFAMAEEMRPDEAGSMLEEMKMNLLKFAVGGDWRPLKHRLGELKLR